MKQKTYFLVHGSYHGAWCWDSVKNELEKNGHIVYALDLPGHGKDTTSRKNVSMKLYVSYVKDFILNNNLTDIILVGHSMGGIVVSQIAELIPERIKKLVFIAGVILNEECFLDVIPESRRDFYLDCLKYSEDKSIPVNPEFVKTCFLNKCSNPIIVNVISKLNPQPFIHNEKIFLKDFKNLNLEVVYIKCSEDKSMTDDYFKTVLDKLPNNYKLIEIESDHEPMFSNPSQLNKILIDA